MNNLLLETMLYFNKNQNSNVILATKKNILKYLKSNGGLVSLYTDKEYYLIDTHMVNKAYSEGSTSVIVAKFIKYFNRNFRDNKLKASSSKKDALFPAADGNYALLDIYFKPVGKMLFQTLDDVIMELGVDYVKDDVVERILNGESVREVLT